MYVFRCKNLYAYAWMSWLHKNCVLQHEDMWVKCKIYLFPWCLTLKRKKYPVLKCALQFFTLFLLFIIFGIIWLFFSYLLIFLWSSFSRSKYSSFLLPFLKIPSPLLVIFLSTIFLNSHILWLLLPVTLLAALCFFFFF